MSRSAESEWLERADAVLADMPTADMRCRLPELERDGKKVVREVAIRVSGKTWVATYSERSGDVGAPFKPVKSVVVDSAIEAFLWGATCGY